MKKAQSIPPIAVFIFIIFVTSISLVGCGNSGDGGSTTTTATTTAPKYDILKIISSIPSSSQHVANIQISNNIAYVAYGFDGVRISDLTDPGKPQQIAYIDPYSATPDSADNIYNLVVSNNILALALNPGCSGFCLATPETGALHFYDISDPKNPVFLSSLDGSSEDILIEGSFLYVSRYSSTTISFARLDIVDISNPHAPTLIGSTPIAASGHLAKRGSIIFISYNDLIHFQGIQAIDVSDPSNPVALGLSENGAIGVFHAPLTLYENFAYVADEGYGIHIFDVSNPVSPSAITTISPGTTKSVSSSSNGYLFSANGSAGVAIYNLQSPQNPVMIQTINTETPAIKVRVFDGIGIVVTQEVGVQKEELNFFLI